MNAIVLTFDRLHIGFLGCYGNQWIETPHFDRLAAESVVFDQHFGENFDESAENHAWWTGCYQFPRSREQQRSQPLLADVLRAAGVESQLLIEHPCEELLPMLSGFDEVIRVDGLDGCDVDEIETPFARLTAEAERCLQAWAAAGDASRLLWLKSRGVPQTVEMIGSGRRELQAVYARRVALLDRHLGELLAAIHRHVGNHEELLLIVTAGKGASLGERPDRPENRVRLWEEIVHTPLLVQVSTAEMGNRRQALVQTVDLVPTLTDWFRVPDGAMECEGQSLLPVVRDEMTRLRDYLCLGDGNRGGGIRTDELYLLKTVHNDTTEKRPDIRLYVKPDDVWEVNDVAAQSAEEVEVLSSTLEEFVLAARQNCPADFPAWDRHKTTS